MFTCFWKMWDWLDPKSMENKKPFIENQGPRNNESPGVPELGPLRGPLMKRQVNTAPQHFRMVQYGMKPSAYTNCQTAVHQQPPQIVQPPGIWAPISMPQQPQQQQQQQQPPNVNSHARLIPNSTPTTPDNQKLAVKPFEPVDGKKKINASSPQLRSPSAKRLTHGTVTMQGWLHKQGSEGLKVWRKRWFVLSDYCLYYYKGPEEEKVLGSILLPSYKVSLCGADDKVYRKFAFKCEHANMRTYYLAADSQELMMNWIRALNLACILQTNVESDRQSGPSVSSMYNPSLENSDSGFHQQYNVHNNVHVHMHSCSNTSGASTSENTVSVSTPSYSLEFGSNGSGGNANNIQPLYANAPPKPRRLTDGGYSSSSPEFLAAERYQQMHQMYGYNVPYRMERACSKSPINNIYVRNCDNRTPNNPTMPFNIANAKLHYNHNHLYEQQMQQATPQRDSNHERRTPDTYGRSKLNKMKDASDYEDVYAVDEVIYKRPLSPVAYSNIKKVSPVASITVQHRPYTPVYIAGPPAPEQNFTPTYKMRLSPIPQPERHQNTIPRPHSADFLDYEVKHRNNNKLNVANCQQPRPKSSLDITRSPSDNYYYSKESYAENMRKSALYLQQLPTHYHTRGNENLIILNGQKGYPGPKHMHEMQQNLRNMPGNEKQFINGSEGSLDIDLSSGPYAKSPISHMNSELGYSNELLNMQRERESPTVRDYHGEHFKRSASARLLRTPVQSSSEDYYGTVNREGDQKREESMKRLLEWKQRMLQSPLNRKMSSGLVMPRTVLSRPDMYVRSANHPHHSHPHVQIPNEVADARDGRRTYVDAPLPQYSSYSSDDEASGSMCMAVHETFPRSMSKKMWSSNAITPSRSSAALNITSRPEHDFEQPRSSPSPYLQNPLQSQSLHREMGQHHANLQKAAWQWTDRMNVSAGELLGRTHEELVLLLIQLRRQSTHTCHAIDTCYAEIDNIQSKLNTMDAAKRLENLQKLEQIKQHLIELEKQYEKGKPLVNLVDNMVKLGSLYRNPSDQHYNINVRDRLEFNQQIQEQRLLAEERRDWNRLSPNHMQLQTKVQQLYHLDRLLQEESGTLQCLQHDKEKIERALGGLRLRLNKCHKDPTEIEQARKQQMHLENELSRVHYMLAQNSKKLEETVAGNARLEQELLVLRQKLQLSRQQRSSAQFSNNGAGDSLPCAAGTSAVLEAELHRVQQLVGDLQRQRQELCAQVRQLTDRSHSLSQQIRPSCLTPINVPNHSMNNKKRVSTSWRETDLDTMHSIDHGIDWDPQNKSRPTTPLYVNTDPNKQSIDCYNRPEDYLRMEDNQQNTECIPQEKTEIKTVRIVKRESERRQRDREKTNIISSDNHQLKWDSVVEEDDQGLNSFYIPSSRNETNINSVFPETPITNHLTVMDKSNNILNRNGSVSSPSLYSQTNSYTSDAQTNSSDALSLDKSPVLSPVFKSEAARQIIIEMSGVQSEPSTLKNSARRTVPKEKRRHYTAPHNNLIMKSLSNFPTDNKACIDSRRARDDLDMERALRQRTDTPDVVRSTMSSRELKYNENTIDNILGTPNKITIPERYIPEQLPQLSAEEQRQRLRKVESIKKMLSDTTILSSSSSAPPPPTNTNNPETVSEGDKTENTATVAAAKASSKIVEEKRQRERLLQLNQILAKQVMEMSKIVAVKALANLPLESQKASVDEEDLSPVTPLPLYQQRDNYYT